MGIKVNTVSNVTEEEAEVELASQLDMGRGRALGWMENNYGVPSSIKTTLTFQYQLMRLFVMQVVLSAAHSRSGLPP